MINSYVMRLLVVMFLAVVALQPAWGQTNTTLIDKLKEEISHKKQYDQQKEQKIAALKQQLNASPLQNTDRYFDLCSSIYNEYKSYQYDSAYVYADKLYKLSIKVNNTSQTYQAKLKIAFILLSSGLFKEAFDNLKAVGPKLLPDSARFDYYSLLTRANYDLAAFNNEKYYTPLYNAAANRYIDSAIALSKPGSYNHQYLSGYKALKNGKRQIAQSTFNNLLKQKLTRHQYAIVTSTLSNLYLPVNQQKGVDLLIHAAIGDIQSSTKETVALLWLAEHLYKQGNNKDAYDFLQQAMADAEFYGARQRQLQISTVLPIVAAQQLSYSESERTRFLTYFLLITVLAVVVIVITILLFKQLKAVQAQEKIIEDKNAELETTNSKLTEDARIKEDYIGHFFDSISGYIAKLEKLKHSIETKLTLKKYDEIRTAVTEINIKKEREQLFYTFDHVFLKIFPNFVADFNALFDEKDQIWPREHEVLTTDLRIFALMRLGITDVQAVANILEYTEKTIYVYKMRIKAKAKIHGDEFDDHIMRIRAV